MAYTKYPAAARALMMWGNTPPFAPVQAQMTAVMPVTTKTAVMIRKIRVSVSCTAYFR